MRMTYMICFHNDEYSLVRRLIIKIESGFEKQFEDTL